MDGLRLKLTLKFTQWCFRCSISFLGVIIIDTVKAWNLEQEPMADHDTLVALATELIHNNLC